VSTTKNEQLLIKTQRLPYRLVLKLLPLHTLIELRAESRLTWLRLSRRGIDRRYSAAEDLLVNVGCGPNGLSGWVNIDCAALPGVTCVRDCRTEIPLPTGSVRGIFTEHFVEHLDYYEEAPRFIAECRRVLRPGGVLRIIVPDGGRYLEAYSSGRLADMAAFSPLITMDPASDIAPFGVEKAVLPFETKMEVVNFHFRQGGQHKFSYDFETLSRLFQESGFEQVVRASYGSSRMPELAIDTESRAAESLVVEATAPGGEFANDVKRSGS
jgi:hypothetical protein